MVTKNDAKKRKINIQESEMVSIMSDILESQSKTVRRKRLDTVSKTNRCKVQNKLTKDVKKSLEFVETYRVIPKQLVCETLTGDPCVINADSKSHMKVCLLQQNTKEGQCLPYAIMQ